MSRRNNLLSGNIIRINMGYEIITYQISRGGSLVSFEIAKCNFLFFYEVIPLGSKPYSICAKYNVGFALFYCGLFSLRTGPEQVKKGMTDMHCHQNTFCISLTDKNLYTNMYKRLNV